MGTTYTLIKNLEQTNDIGMLLKKGILPFGIVTKKIYYEYYKRELSKTLSNKLLLIFGFFGIVIFLISVVFKISHWPGAKVLFLASIAIINLAYFPILFFRMYRKSIG